MLPYYVKDLCNAIMQMEESNMCFLLSVAPGPPYLVTLEDGGNDTSLTVTWAPPTTGDALTSYNVSINDSIGTSWIMPHDGSPSYIHTFAGLTSNTLYSVTVVAINCAGSTGVTVNNYTCKEFEFKCFLLLTWFYLSCQTACVSVLNETLLLLFTMM